MLASFNLQAMAGNIVIFDTSVMVDHLRTGRHQERIDSLTGLVRTSSVVLAELWRGATKSQEHKFLEALTRKSSKFGPDKLRDLHFDVLIALTARSHGALLVTPISK